MIYKAIEDIKGTKAAISRYGSGSHLMAFINAENNTVRQLSKELEQLTQIKNRSNSSMAQLALNYCLQQKTIDNVLIGVDSKQQLEDNLNSLNYTLENRTVNEINNIKVANINLLNPSLWN